VARAAALAHRQAWRDGASHDTAMDAAEAMRPGDGVLGDLAFGHVDRRGGVGGRSGTLLISGIDLRLHEDDPSIDGEGVEEDGET
jgi:hypothetical protein